MRTTRMLIGLLAVTFVAATSTWPQQSPKAKAITIIGKVTRAMGIGGESSRWTLELNREITLEGQKLNSIEISGAAEDFEKLKDQRVKARGTITHHHGVERGDYLVLEVSSVRATN